jgi:uncharacterized protein (TIGR02594 family)
MIPEKYNWLTKIGTLPRIVETGLKLIGTQEVIGRGSNATIMSWRDTLNTRGVSIAGYSDDDIPWCGLFLAFLAYLRRGLPLEVVSSPLWARNWLKYGIKAQKPMLGDVLVFSRGNSGHVGIYIAEDSDCFHVLGGNQSNKVSITRIEKSRLLGARRPKYNSQPASVKQYLVAKGGSISTNES